MSSVNSASFGSSSTSDERKSYQTTNLFHMIHKRNVFGQFPIQSHFRNKLDTTTPFNYQHNLVGHYGCVNAINFSHDHKWLCSGGDDTRVLLWSVTDHCLDTSGKASLPPVKTFVGGHNSNIFCTIFDADDRHIISCGNDGNIARYDLEKMKRPIQTFRAHSIRVGQVSGHPTDSNRFISCGDDGCIFFFDCRANTSPKISIRNRCCFNSISYHPVNDHLIIASDSRSGIYVYDSRSLGNRSIFSNFATRFKISSKKLREDIWDVCFNNDGSQFLCTIRRGPLTLFDFSIPDGPICEFHDESYRNGCTVKHCCFVDNYAVSGTDDWKIKMWKIPSPHELMQNKEGSTSEDEENANNSNQKKCFVINQSTHTLIGHQCNVNNMKYLPNLSLLASSGVEKTIKCWNSLGENNSKDVKIRKPMLQSYGNMEIAEDDDEDEMMDDETTSESKKILSYFDYLNYLEHFSDIQSADDGAESSGSDIPLNEESDEDEERRNQIISERLEHSISEETNDDQETLLLTSSDIFMAYILGLPTLVMSQERQENVEGTNNNVETQSIEENNSGDDEYNDDDNDDDSYHEHSDL